MSDKKEFPDDIRVRIPSEWTDRLKSEAKKENLKVSDIVRRALDRFLKAPSARLRRLATKGGK